MFKSICYDLVYDLIHAIAGRDRKIFVESGGVIYHRYEGDKSGIKGMMNMTIYSRILNHS